MGKIPLQLEVDEALVRDLEARGIDPLRFAEVGFSDAYDRATRWHLAESAKLEAKNPTASARRAQDWEDENTEAIAERNARIREHGVLSDYEPFRPRWTR